MFNLLRLNHFRASPIIVALAVYFLYQVLGPACLAGFGFMVLFLPFNSIIMASAIRKNQVRQLHIYFIVCNNDERQ